MHVGQTQARYAAENMLGQSNTLNSLPFLIPINAIEAIKKGSQLRSSMVTVMNWKPDWSESGTEKL